MMKSVPRTPEAQPRDARRTTASLGPTVLVTDDDDALRSRVAAALRRDGYSVMEAGSSQEAVDTLEELCFHDGSLCPVDLILVGVRIPDSGGLHVAEVVREAGWRIPVILMSAFPGPFLHSEAERLRAALLVKPFKLEFLRRIVLSTLAAHRSAS